MGAAISKLLWLTGYEQALPGYQVFVHGGQFVWARTFNLIQRNEPTSISDRAGFKLLLQRVATSALHNSAQRANPPRCHPNTREAILQQIFDWMVASKDREAWLMWLNGAAGAGKTAIAQSTSERCIEAKRIVVSFFFSGTDSIRNNMDFLAATLAYQLLQLIPETSEYILQAIERNPHIFSLSIKSQIKELFINPLVHVRHLFPEYFLLVVLDGLDECGNEVLQREGLIQALGEFTSTRNIPALFLIASRPHFLIETAFNQQEVAKISVSLPLDDVAKVTDDIRCYLQDKFAELKVSHKMGPDLPDNWPTSSSIEKIITNSSGQFIYASLVINYITSPRDNPIHQLQIIEGIRAKNPLSQHPLAHLDALYQHIFSSIRADFLNKILDILAYILLAGENRMSVINWAFQFEPGEVEIVLLDLVAVITCDRKENLIRFLHMSLTDFLLDSDRSDAYHINSNEYSTKLACMVFALPPKHYFGGYDTQKSVFQLLQTAPQSILLQQSLLQFTPGVEVMHLTFKSSLLPMLHMLETIEKLACYYFL